MPLKQISKENLIQRFQESIRKEPTKFLHLIGSDYWEGQKQILDAIFKYRKVSVKTCHGCGKSYIIARIILAWLFSHENDALAITTAPTFRQVRKITWREIHSAYIRSIIPLGGKLNETEYKISPDRFAFGYSPEHPDAGQGMHSKNLLSIIEEASGVDDDILEANDTQLIGLNNKILMVGNPTNPIGKFAESFKSESFHKITITAFDTPNFTYNNIHNPEQLATMNRDMVENFYLPAPFLITPLWVWEKINDWGIDSPPFQSRIMAIFPEEGDDILIPYKLLEQSLALDEDEFEYITERKVIGIDVARYGHDKTVLITIDEHKQVGFKAFQGQDTMKTVGEAIQMFKEYKMNKTRDIIGVDDIGVGGGVTDRLRELGYNVKAINFGEKSEKDWSTRDINPTNLKSQIYWHARQIFQNKQFKIIDNGKLLSELSTIRYNILSDGKMEILSKDKMKKLGYNSPDHADALVIALWCMRKNQNNKEFTFIGQSTVGNIYNKTF